MGVKENGEGILDHSTYIDTESKRGNEVESDCEPAKGSPSAHSNENGNNRLKKNSRVPKKLANKNSGGNYLRPMKVSSSGQEQKNQQSRSLNYGSKKSQKPSKFGSTTVNLENKNLENIKVPSRSSSELCEGTDEKTIEEVKEMDVLDEAPICDQSVGTDDSVADAEENNLDDVKPNAYQKVEEMELRIEKLEEELKEVAALEISLYSFIPEHGGSAHKVHTPARRLFRLYIHACKHWSHAKRATVAKNTISGLVLIAKSCGNDVPRLTFWLSNTVVLREIISQTTGSVTPSSVVMMPVDLSNYSTKYGSRLQLLTSKNIFEGKQGKMLGYFQQADDWQETCTFLAALEKLESWIFSRAVESVWWQALTPHMQSPVEDMLCHTKRIGKLLGPTLGDPKQGDFSVNLWKSAFDDAFLRLCPVRSEGHECGCLPMLARLVMEQCVCRLDVAMFNAILRESVNEMPTDPISDPIVDPKVLPIPAGYLSFGSGAQLKNSIGNWDRWLKDLLCMDADNSGKAKVNDNEDDNIRRVDVGLKCFPLLNELSDLLMLPKDMLLERTIRKEVCPTIGLPLITRVLCNFIPDEFCPDPVPSIVLEELNSESLIECRLPDNEQINIFPCAASPVVYSPIPLPDLAEKAVDTDKILPKLHIKESMVLRRGYTSDDDLDDLDDPLASIIHRTPRVSPSIAGGRIMQKQTSVSNCRYNLLREVWC